MKNLETLKTDGIKESVRKLYQTKERFKDVQARAKQIEMKESKAISNWMFSNLPENQNSFEIDISDELSFNDGKKLRVTKVRTKKVEWLIDKLKQNISKELFSEIVTKTYTIKDINGLIKYLKSCGVDPKKFKTFIEVKEEVNEQKFDTLYQTGKVKAKEIEDCYKVKLGEPYFRFTDINE